MQALVWSQSAEKGNKQNNTPQLQSRPSQNSGQMGSQANPVDITTPQIPVNNNIPSFAQQPAGTFAPPPLPQRQPSSSGPGSGQTNPQQWSQPGQQQQQSQGKPQVHQSPNRGKAWAGIDFSKAHSPISEDKFLAYVASAIGDQTGNFTPPSIQGRVVDLYSLFNLVHRNGGSVKVSPLSFK
jgi:hypothetical protein